MHRNGKNAVSRRTTRKFRKKQRKHLAEYIMATDTKIQTAAKPVMETSDIRTARLKERRMILVRENSSKP